MGKGLGLGLSISYNIVRDFGGTLAWRNHPEGGAVFTVDLAAAPRAAEANGANDPARLLLVDDEEACALLAEQTLTWRG